MLAHLVERGRGRLVLACAGDVPVAGCFFATFGGGFGFRLRVGGRGRREPISDPLLSEGKKVKRERDLGRGGEIALNGMVFPP